MNHRVINLMLRVTLLLGVANVTTAQRIVVEDFNDGILTGNWPQAPFPITVVEDDGHLIIRAQFPDTGGESLNSHSGWWSADSRVRDGETVEYRVDLVRASRPTIITGIEFNNTEVPGGGGYGFHKKGDELELLKMRFDTSTTALFMYEVASIKRENVTLSLALTGAGDNVVITCRVLDKDQDDATLFEKTVVDTPEVDPTLFPPGLKHLTSDIAGSSFAFLGSADPVLNFVEITDGNQPEAEVIYDNLMYEIRGPEFSNVEKAIRLSWPAFSSPHVVEGAPSVEGPWTEVTEPVLEVDGMNYVTIPAVEGDTLEIFRLRM